MYNSELIAAAAKVLRLSEDTANWKVFSHRDFTPVWIDRAVKTEESKKLLYAKVTEINDDLQTITLHGVFGDSYQDVYIRSITIAYRSDHNYSVSISKTMKDFAIDYFEGIKRVGNYVKSSSR